MGSTNHEFHICEHSTKGRVFLALHFFQNWSRWISDEDVECLW